MKKLIVLAMAVFMLFTFSAFAEPHNTPEAEEDTASVTGIPERVEKGCPTAGFLSDNMKCTDCHVLSREGGKYSWGIREVEPFADKNPPYGWEWKVGKDGKPYGFHQFSSISPNVVKAGLEYFDRHPEVDRIVINVFSPGGSVFFCWKAIKEVQKFYNRFHIVTTCDSAAFSAGLLFFLVGEERLVSEYASLMAHEIKGFSYMEEKYPSMLEEEAKLFRKWQTKINQWIEDRTNKKLTVEGLEELTAHIELWMDGVEAVEDYGVAHGYM